MKYIAQRPTEPGFYWMKCHTVVNGKEIEEDTMIELTANGEFEQPARLCLKWVDELQLLDHSCDASFAGPIQKPSEGKVAEAKTESESESE